MAVIDIDHFEAIDDRFGRTAVDQVMVGVAGRLRSILRPQDVIARVGGEEFVLVLQDMLPERVALVAERVRQTVAGAPVETNAGPIPVILSMGVAKMHAHEASAEAVQRADRALHHAKREGRDQAAFTDPVYTD